jgi:predicted AAA+ superfamily ATPase
VLIPRRAAHLVEDRLRLMPAVVLIGPRQVGKTTLARQLAAARGPRAMYLDLERAADRRRLDDPDAFLRAQAGKLIVVDEIHRAPDLFAPLRGIIDERRAAGERAGHFLLLGSASIDLLRQASESLAGRVAAVELSPLDAGEVANAGVGDVDQLWVRGGFPESFLPDTDEDSLVWRQSFVRSYLERDVPMFAPRLPAETIGRLWTMLAHAQGSLLNQARLASSLAVSSPAIGRYIDLLVDLLLVRRLRPWSGNVGKRLVRSPKVYVRDSGLVHALLELETWEDVLGHPVAGFSWEGFAIENLIAAGGERRIPSFYRTEDGAEVDLVFERGGSVEMAIEIKRTTAPSVSRGFRSGIDNLRPGHAYLVHAGRETWPAGSGITAISLRDLMDRLLAAPRASARAGQRRGADGHTHRDP